MTGTGTERTARTRKRNKTVPTSDKMLSIFVKRGKEIYGYDTGPL